MKNLMMIVIQKIYILYKWIIQTMIDLRVIKFDPMLKNNLKKELMKNLMK